MTILFQFVTPPPPQPRPQLPASVRGSALSGHGLVLRDHRGASRSCSTCVLVIYLRNVDWPRKPDIEAVPDRFVQMVVKKGREEAGAEEGRGREEPKRRRRTRRRRATRRRRRLPRRSSPTRRRRRSPRRRPRPDAERRARLAEQVKSTGLLKLLGAQADGGGSIADVLGKGDVDRDQEKAFQGVGGVGVASGNDQLRGIKSGGSGLGTRGRARAACAAAAPSRAAAPARRRRRRRSRAS